MAGTERCACTDTRCWHAQHWAQIPKRCVMDAVRLVTVREPVAIPGWPGNRNLECYMCARCADFHESQNGIMPGTRCGCSFRQNKVGEIIHVHDGTLPARRDLCYRKADRMLKVPSEVFCLPTLDSEGFEQWYWRRLLPLGKEPNLIPGPFRSRTRAEKAASMFTLPMCGPCADFHESKNSPLLPGKEEV